MKHVVVLTGAGISAESGLKTFRDGDGLWEGYNVQDVATPEAWQRDPELVLRFYDERRKQVIEAKPNEAHLCLAHLEEHARVSIITQNIDDLHERAGSSNVTHLHGEILKAQSSVDPDLIYDIKGETLSRSDRCEKNSPLRPHVVWFGEAVPMMETAIEITSQADIMLVIGTSLVVYPAASLIHYCRPGTPIAVVDPKADQLSLPDNECLCIPEPATTGVKKALSELSLMGK